MSKTTRINTSLEEELKEKKKEFKDIVLYSKNDKKLKQLKDIERDMSLIMAEIQEEKRKIRDKEAYAMRDLSVRL